MTIPQSMSHDPVKEEEKRNTPKTTLVLFQEDNITILTQWSNKYNTVKHG